MKNFSYQWDEDYYLLHIQFDRTVEVPFTIKIRRDFKNTPPILEEIPYPEKDLSYRFLVARSRPSEISFFIEYPEEMILSAYKLDDRAYYPTEHFYKG
ncbi:MAG: hypothetical protein HQM08_18810 [Candidatus Riflebacteria bacterium]|nr:hypothetical protein [Candidatus Riflebacteria bacterium]